MITALEKIDSSGGKVVYNAPLLMPEAIMKEYGTAQMNDLLSECLHSTPESSRWTHMQSAWLTVVTSTRHCVYLRAISRLV